MTIYFKRQPHLRRELGRVMGQSGVAALTSQASWWGEFSSVCYTKHLEFPTQELIDYSSGAPETHTIAQSPHSLILMNHGLFETLRLVCYIPQLY